MDTLDVDIQYYTDCPQNEAATRVLVLSGTREDEEGRSVLTDQSLSFPRYYVMDCSKVGFKAVKEITDVNADRQKKTLKSSFIGNDRINKMNFQVLNLAWYSGNQSKLVEDIKKFQPIVLCVAFKMNVDLNSDLMQVLTMCGMSKANL